MAKIRFLYHKPTGERGIGKAIVGWTFFLGLFYNWKVLKYNYSHEEIWFPDGRERFVRGYVWENFVCCGNAGRGRGQQGRKIPIFTGQCFSSTTRGDAEGVRFAPASDVLEHPERWDYIEVEVDEERLEVAIDECKRQVGSKYDFLGIFGFLNPIPVQDGLRWYCSEICDWFKCLLRIYPKRHKRISPRRSAYLLAEKYGEPKSLIVF